MADYTFLCYAHEDTRFALRLARALQGQGLSVWVDQWQIAPAEDWERELAQALRSCNFFLLILSPAAVNSWVVRDQTLLALSEGKSVVAIAYQDCALPPVLQNIQPIPFNPVHFQEGVQQLYNRLGGESRSPRVKSPLLLFRTIWNRLEGPRLLPLLSVAVIILFSLVGFSLWSQRQAESWVVPEPVEPALISQPMVVPTVKNLSAPNPLPTPLNIKVRPEDGKVMVLIPEGDFLMGSAGADPAAAEDEKPQHLVYLDTFWIDKTEITNAQYRRCVVIGVCSPPQSQVSDFRGPQFPVVGVDWNQAHTYCEWVGGRLPTEAEWEKAARGPDGRLYPWGNTFDDTRLNYCDTNCIADWRDFKGDDGYRFTAPVGNYLSGASPYGVLDMSGNVWEWTADWYASDSYQHTTYRNPAGPEQGEQRVIRGGSWYYQDKSSRIAKRHKDTPTARYDNIGFRCALPGSEKSNDLSYRFVPTHIPAH